MDYFVTAILGVRGAGKTLLMAALAESYRLEGFEIVANFHLKRIDYKYATFEEIATLPDWLANKIVLMDEIQVGADSYEFLNKRVKKLTTDFVTQLRKRKIQLFYTTQVFTQTAKRMRMQTNFIMEMHKTRTPGVPLIRTFDRSMPPGMQMIREWTPDLREWFDAYDTNEVISVGEVIEDEDSD